MHQMSRISNTKRWRRSQPFSFWKSEDMIFETWKAVAVVAFAVDILFKYFAVCYYGLLFEWFGRHFLRASWLPKQHQTGYPKQVCLVLKNHLCEWHPVRYVYTGRQDCSNFDLYSFLFP